MIYDKKTGTESKFIIGLDLGQANDYTGLVIVERLRDWMEGMISADRDPIVISHWTTTREVEDPVYHVRHIERMRLGTPYPEVVEHVQELIATQQIGGKSGLIIDYTGVGRPVFDMVTKAGLEAVGVTITGGDAVKYGRHQVRVAKRILVSTVIAVMQTGRLKFAEGMRGADALQSELLNFRVKITDSANDIYSAREGTHDDLVIALALALFAGEKLMRDPGVVQQFRW